MKFIKSALVCTLFFSSVAIYGADRQASIKMARSKDPIAAKYMLDADGQLFAVSKIQDGVEDFKVSQHPNDVGLMYFVRKDAFDRPLLWILQSDGKAHTLPKTEPTEVAFVNGQYKYVLTSTTHTTIVLLVLDVNGTLKAWDNQRVVAKWENIVDFRSNVVFGKSGEAFSSYVAFAIDGNGHVIKVKGNQPEGSKVDSADSYRSLRDFFEGNKIRW